MKVLIVNTSELSGGAAVAANRLMHALNRNSVEARTLVCRRQTSDDRIIPLGGAIRKKWHFLWERLRIFLALRLHRQHLWDVDTGFCGSDITHLPAFKEADIIHLHWINQGMLSLRGIRRILRSGKPVVWTMHDMWPATAICHLTLGCEAYTTQCRRCRLLPHAKSSGSGCDLSTRVWKRKQRILNGHGIAFVGCSRWLMGEARKSALLKGQKIISIPNPIDTDLYRPASKSEARARLSLPEGKKLILFAAQRVTNTNKGISFLAEAIKGLTEQDPSLAERWEMVVLGSSGGEVERLFPLRCHIMGYISEPARLIDIYNASDLFVLPSLSENLPNTIMEAMACGVPCVGFRVGGIPEEIDHLRNGYVAAYRDAKDLGKGLSWVLGNPDYAGLASDARRKVVSTYGEKAVASQYISLYRQLLRSKPN